LIGVLSMSLCAHAQDAQQPATQPAPPGAQASAPPARQTSIETPVGSVAAVTGNATDFRNGAPVTTLKVGDAILKGDLLQTDGNGSLAVTFDDDTTVRLGPSATLVVSEFLFEQGGSKNSALFNVVRGSAAFVASFVAKTGDMKIATPTATLGIRGTSGLVDVPDGGGRDVSIKLYPDANGTVGRIDVFGAGGVQLGTLSRAATGFAIRPGAGGRFAAVPLQISPQQAARDRAFVQQTFAAQRVGRQLTIRRRQQQPGPQRQPNLQRGPNQPGQPNRQQNRQGQPNRPGQPSLQGQPGRQGQTNRPAGQTTQGQPSGAGPAGQPARPGQLRQQGQPGQQNPPDPRNTQSQPNPSGQATPQGQPALQGQPTLQGQPNQPQPTTSTRGPGQRKPALPKPARQKRDNQR
jgi:FecR protein